MTPALGVHMNAFFFSSRRRHTRSLRDWSSDVCSSDLHNAITATSSQTDDCGHGTHVAGIIGAALNNRSEERRVGKECRSRGETYPLKKETRVTAAALEASTLHFDAPIFFNTLRGHLAE